MKDFVTMKRQKSGSYHINASSQEGPLSLLYFFLCGDASMDFEANVADINDPETYKVTSNFTYFDKIGNGNIVLGTIHEDELGWGIIKCTDKQLEKLIRDWQQILIEQPEYVTITQADNGDFIVVGSDTIN